MDKKVGVYAFVIGTVLAVIFGASFSLILGFLGYISLKITTGVLLFGALFIIIFGIIMYVIVLINIAKNNKEAFGEYSKSIIAGLVGGMTLIILGTLKDIYNEKGIFNYSNVLNSSIAIFISLFIIIIGGLAFIFIYSRLERRK